MRDVKLAAPGQPHLTYCSNIHPGESWAEVRANLARYVPAVRDRVAPDRAFGVGLRLSAQAAEELSRGEALEELRALLRSQRLYVHTINGFPYGRFHGEPVKEAVYLPDWLDERRLSYSDRLASILAALLPAEEPALAGCVSTVPGAFRARVTGDEQVARMVELLLRHAAALHRLAERSGRVIVLALEPEPCCYLETIGEAVRFFEERLYARAALARFAALAGVGRAESEAVLRRHLGVCLDACHMAVEFEDAQPSLEALRAAGIRIGKIQLSTGLRVRIPARRSEALALKTGRSQCHGNQRKRDRSQYQGNRPEASADLPDIDSDPFPSDEGSEVLAALRRFADPVYLHQVVERRGDGTYRRFADLPEALATLEQGAPEPREWRVHFHVPLFLRALGPFGNTQDQLDEVLRLLRARAYTEHLEVETYTWDVLPDEYRRDDIVTSIARELNWVLERLPA